MRLGHIEKCGSCPEYNHCGGDRNAAYAENGNFLGPDPGCWIDLENNIQLQKGKFYAKT